MFGRMVREGAGLSAALPSGYCTDTFAGSKKIKPNSHISENHESIRNDSALFM
jgi:hypothetical protein